MKKIQRTFLLFLLPAWLCNNIGVSQLRSEIDSTSFETPFLRFSILAKDGSYTLEDKQAHVMWRSNPFQARFGEVTLKIEKNVRHRSLSDCKISKAETGITATFRPLTENTNFEICVRVAPLKDGRTLELAYDSAGGIEMLELLRAF